MPKGLVIAGFQFLVSLGLFAGFVFGVILNRSRSAANRKLNGKLVDRIKGCILTEENLEELVRITNDELAQTCDAERSKIDLNAQMAEVDSRLGKPYDSLRTGEFKGGELAPRIKLPFEKKERLQQVKAEA